MLLGGYQILDFENKNLSSSKTFAGIYDLIEGCQKPFLLVNVYDGTTEFKPFFQQCLVSSSNFTFACGTKTITITSADGVTIA